MARAEEAQSLAVERQPGIRPSLSYGMEAVRLRSAEARFNVISTFSGGGGSSIGYRLAGGQVLGANEFVPEAARTYKANFPDTHLDMRDIRAILSTPNALEEYLSLAGTAPGEPDCFEGSPPCCQFSSVGSGISDQDVMRSYSDTRQKHIATLPHDWAQFALGVNAKTVVMENVPEIMTAGAEILAGVIRVLESNYLVKVEVLAARDFGVPQRRRRAFLIGVRRDVAARLGMSQSEDMLPIFPQPTSHAVSIREAFTDLVQSAKDVLPFVTSARTTGLGTLISKLPKEPLKHTRLRHVSPGETKHFTLVRTSWDLPSPTLTASGQKPNGLTGVAHPLFDRKFTIPELKRLTSLPDDFALTGTLSQAAERICRMVPPFLTAAVADSIYRNILEPLRRSQ